MDTIQEQINRINNRNLNLALGFATACTILARIVSFSWNFKAIWSPFSFTITALTVVFGLIYLLRSRLSYQTKMYSLLAIVFIFFCMGLYNRALYSPVVSFLVIIPMIQSFIGSFRLATAVNLILLVLYLVVGALVIYSPAAIEKDWAALMMNPWIWITDISIIFSITLATVFIDRANNQLLVHIHDSLEDQRDLLDQQAVELQRRKAFLEEMVGERTRELQEANNRLHERNIQIAEKNLEIAWRNEETEKTLSEIRRIEADLLDSDKLASVGIFANGITQNISAPLAVIREEHALLQELAQSESPEKKRSITELTEILKNGTERLKRVLNDLKKINVTDSEKPVDLREIARSAIEAVRTASRPKAAIELRDPGHNVSVRANGARLERILINLLNNACHAVEGNENGRIDVRFIQEQEYLTAVVADNGHGISPAILKRITEPFFTTKDPGKGTGLGLFLCQSLMTDLGGRLDIQSEEGKGTSIFLRFPVHDKAVKP